MLWKKESRQSDALYVDVFKPNTQRFDAILNSLIGTIDQAPHPKKSDAIALEKRDEGNRLFRSSTIEAMALYSDSLRYACPGSEHISLAYANRASCFLKLKMYDECLIDVKHAMEAGYPERLRPKLNDRKAKCVKEMQENPEHSREKFSIEPDEKFSCLSNMAKVQCNGGRDDYSVVAKEDIDVGLPIVIEDAYFAYVMDCSGLYCNICAKEFCNLVPCEKCAVAMFCSECQGHSLHEYECGLNICGASEFNSDILRLVRGILLATKIFATADELMVFVEQMLKHPNELPDTLLDDRSKFQAYFNTPIKQVKLFDRIRLLIFSVFKTIMRIPYVNEMFKTTRHRRFLMHLIGHYTKIPPKNAGASLYAGLLSPLGQPIRYRLLMDSYFKHSCYPNMEYVMCGNKFILYSIKPIKQGEKLFISFAPDINSTVERKKLLLNELQIKCECSRCQGKVASPAQRQQLISDPDFRQVQELYSKKGERLMDACVRVLEKYGQMDWCDEIVFVERCFHGLYGIQSRGGFQGFKHPLVRELLPRLLI